MDKEDSEKTIEDWCREIVNAWGGPTGTWRAQAVLRRFANAQLERAARECDDIDGAYWEYEGAQMCAERIRALKYKETADE